MKRFTFTTFAAAAAAALSIGMATSANAAPSGPDLPPRPDTASGGDIHEWFNKPGQNAYGGYQNDNKRQSVHRR
jgi:hypothetical protein